MEVIHIGVAHGPIFAEVIQTVGTIWAAAIVACVVLGSGIFR